MALIMQGIYFIIFLISFLVFNMLSGGLLKHIIFVRVSAGKKILVHIKGVDQWYWNSAILNSNYIRYKDKDKLKKSLIITDYEVMTRSFNLPSCMVDDVKNSFLKPNLEGVSGFDAKHVDNIILRGLTAPTIEDDKIKMIALIVAGAVIIAVGYLVFKVIPALDVKLNMIGSAIESLK